VNVERPQLYWKDGSDANEEAIRQPLNLCDRQRTGVIRFASPSHDPIPDGHTVSFVSTRFNLTDASLRSPLAFVAVRIETTRLHQ